MKQKVQIREEHVEESTSRDTMIRELARELDRLLGISQLMRRLDELERRVALVESSISDLVPRIVSETVKALTITELVSMISETRKSIQALNEHVNKLEQFYSTEVTAVLTRELVKQAKESIPDALKPAVEKLNEVVQLMREYAGELSVVSKELSAHISQLVEVARLAEGFRTSLQTITKLENEFEKTIQAFNNALQNLDTAVTAFNALVDRLGREEEVARVVRSGGSGGETGSG